MVASNPVIHNYWIAKCIHRQHTKALVRGLLCQMMHAVDINIDCCTSGIRIEQETAPWKSTFVPLHWCRKSSGVSAYCWEPATRACPYNFQAVPDKFSTDKLQNLITTLCMLRENISQVTTLLNAHPSQNAMELWTLKTASNLMKPCFTDL